MALGKEKFRAALPPNLSLNTPLALRIGLGFLFFEMYAASGRFRLSRRSFRLRNAGGLRGGALFGRHIRGDDKVYEATASLYNVNWSAGGDDYDG